MQRNLPSPETCLFDGQPLNMTEIMQPGLDVLYIFAGRTSLVGLSTARLTGSFFRTQHTEPKEKRVCVGNCMQSSVCNTSHLQRKPMTTDHSLQGSELNISIMYICLTNGPLIDLLLGDCFL